MAKYIHYLNPASTELGKELESISKCPGTCFFIDLVGSTAIKYKEDLKSWGRKLNNTFNFISILNDFPNNVVKGIGDEIMLYIPDEELNKKSTVNDYFSLLQEIYSTIYNIKYHPLQDSFMQCKVAIHHCLDVYNITFLEGVNDYYGKDIDLSARLMSKSRANRIVISEAFYQKVIKNHQDKYSNYSTSYLEHISEKFVHEFKGVPSPVSFRHLEV